MVDQNSQTVDEHSEIGEWEYYRWVLITLAISLPIHIHAHRHTQKRTTEFGFCR